VTIVVDASAMVAALVDSGPDGAWAEQQLSGHQLTALHLMPVEVANVLRRAALAGDLSDDIATLAHGDLIEIRVALFPYEPLAERVWELRRYVTAYDACYVALAERLDAPLVTLDGRLATAPGPTCSFRTPPTTS
jgi:predicted nucleic acid-binding protein